MRNQWSVQRRTTLIAVGVATTVVALLVTFFVVGSVGSSRNSKSQRAENYALARVIASTLGSSARPADLAAFRPLLVAEQERVTVTTARGSFSVGADLTNSGALLQVSTPIVGGTLSVLSPADAGLDPPIEFVLVTLGVLLAVLASVAMASRVISRRTRQRVDETIVAAERVSLGDFTARVGAGGPEPIARLGRAFDMMASRLESIDREQREFLADLAHEIVTPVQALSGFSHAVIDGTISPEVARSAIESQTSRLSDLLDELAQLRSIDTPGAVRHETVDLDALCHSLYREFAPLATEAGLDFRYRGEPVTLASDPRLVATVLSNFLTNAFRYTPAGQRVTLSCSSDPDRVVLSVSDSGPGIASQHQHRIFDRFYRTAEARDRISGGSGLGLTIARSAAHSLGGHIELDSSLERGSDFRLVLPTHGSDDPAIDVVATGA
ncbi:MAG TPA: HAMP domain-containing sensor histidine kinase [Acidimicrobiales bacterium]|nr:HAMP domain-containing sensor histidine kinase [Acidimicrobiales bacterium]